MTSRHLRHLVKELGAHPFNKVSLNSLIKDLRDEQSDFGSDLLQYSPEQFLCSEILRLLEYLCEDDQCEQTSSCDVLTSIGRTDVTIAAPIVIRSRETNFFDNIKLLRDLAYSASWEDMFSIICTIKKEMEYTSQLNSLGEFLYIHSLISALNANSMHDAMSVEMIENLIKDLAKNNIPKKDSLFVHPFLLHSENSCRTVNILLGTDRAHFV